MSVYVFFLFLLLVFYLFYVSAFKSTIFVIEASARDFVFKSKINIIRSVFFSHFIKLSV